MRFACLLLLLCVSLPGISRAAAALRDPWPTLAAVGDDFQAEQVTFPSSDPFSPAEIGHAPIRATRATLYMPPHAAPDHSTPAVVMLHGAGGLIAERGDTYGRQLAGMGVAVLVVDTYGSRTDLATSFIGRALNITETMFDADAYGGLRFLAARPEIDGRRVVLAGFSYGAMATMYALYAEVADRFVPPGLRFAGHVAFYGPCIARFDDSRTTGAPLLMLYGDEDELIRPDRCAQVAADVRAGGSEVTVVAYRGAVHQWDGAFQRRLIGRNLAACDFRVDRGGTIHDAGSGVSMLGPLTRKVLLALCVSSDPYPIGRDDAVRARSNRDFGRFLARVFAGPPT